MENQSLSAHPPSDISSPNQLSYDTPAVVYEAALEIRAGTCQGGPDPLDLFGLSEN
jgi:hypothetical protein